MKLPVAVALPVASKYPSYPLTRTFAKSISLSTLSVTVTKLAKSRVSPTSNEADLGPAITGASLSFTIIVIVRVSSLPEESFTV